MFLDKIALVNNKEPDWDYSLISDCVCPVCHSVCIGGKGGGGGGGGGTGKCF